MNNILIHKHLSCWVIKLNTAAKHCVPRDRCTDSWLLYLVCLLHFRTLGGVPTQASLPLEATSSQIICPDGVTSANFYPETWVYMHPSQDFIQVPVSAEDKSYRIIYNLFHKTVPEFKYRILQILRVQNQFLWEKYKRWVRDGKNLREHFLI